MMPGRINNALCADTTRFYFNISPLLIALFWAVLCLTAMEASAAGTSAGSIISSFATVDYVLNSTFISQKSNTTTIMVDDKVSFTLTAADAANVTITPGGRACLTYVLTNAGNAPHDFTINVAVTGTPEFNPAGNPVFYADVTGTTPLPTDPNAGGLAYFTSLLPNASKTVYMFITAPAALTDGQKIFYLVTAESYLQANLGIVNPPIKSSTQAMIDASVNKNTNLITRYVVLADGHGNGGDLDRDGKYAVIGKDGNNNAIGFKARSATVNISKTATVSDRTGGNQPVSGATVRYTLSISAAGEGNALGVVITDPLPVDTTYTAGTLKLNGNMLSDVKDSDAGDVAETTAGVVTVKLGDITSTTPVQTITFDVKIN